jgi:MFS family permease
MLWFVCFFNYADRQSIYSVFPKLKEEFGFDTVELGLIGSAFMWVYAAGAPFAGFVCDRLRRKDLILGGCVFWSVITALTGWCGKLWQFATVRALEGLGETFYFPAGLSLMSDYHDRRTRSRALSFHQSSVYVGTILGSWLGAWFAEHLGWRMGFYFFGGLGLALALVLGKLLHEPPRGEADALSAGESNRPSPPPAPPNPARRSVPLSSSGGEGRGEEAPSRLCLPGSLAAAPVPSAGGEALTVRQTCRVLFRNPTVPLLMAAFLAANFVATIFLTWTPTFLVEKFGFELASAGLTGAVFIHLASALSVPVAGWLADKLARRFAGGRMLVQAAGLLLGATFVFLVGQTSNTTTLLVAMTGFGLCKGFYDSGIFASLYDVIEPRARGTAAGVMNTVGWGGGALGPLCVGLAAKYGSRPAEMDNMSQAIAACALIYLLGAALLLAAIVRSARASP